MDEEKKAKKEQSPHDALFKSVFGNTEHARAFLEAHLPPDVLANRRRAGECGAKRSISQGSPRSVAEGATREPGDDNGL